ncbi:hypothetical protein LG200_05090 [Methylobacillus caricis]|uniref:hypothetical protein n=1 Tax=Methylobacillus caricis TaxID=1971611 RepID=UPI001CFF70BA|nr:hypothetical protein [Methylobacillus caricis]MCB5187379.1 hypothetical protein [Methylobacillus caricis]
MSDLELQMELLKSALADRFPHRVVTRDLKDFSQRDCADLKRGVYTLLHSAEGNYTNLLGRSAAHGVRSIKIIGQLQIDDGEPPSAMENLEGAMLDEIKEITNNYPAGISHLLLIDCRSSEQMDVPWGWIACRLEMMAVD